MFIDMSCIVSIRDFCRFDWISMSRVNSKTSQSVARDSVKLKVRNRIRRIRLVMIRLTSLGCCI